MLTLLSHAQSFSSIKGFDREENLFRLFKLIACLSFRTHSQSKILQPRQVEALMRAGETSWMHGAADLPRLELFQPPNTTFTANNPTTKPAETVRALAARTHTGTM